MRIAGAGVRLTAASGAAARAATWRACATERVRGCPASGGSWGAVRWMKRAVKRVVTVVTGLVANRGIVDHPPLEVLRQET